MSWEPYKLTGLREALKQLRSALDDGRVRAGMDGNRAAQRHFEQKIADLETTGWNETTLRDYEEYLGQPGMRQYLSGSKGGG